MFTMLTGRDFVNTGRDRSSKIGSETNLNRDPNGHIPHELHEDHESASSRIYFLRHTGTYDDSEAPISLMNGVRAPGELFYVVF